MPEKELKFVERQACHVAICRSVPPASVKSDHTYVKALLWCLQGLCGVGQPIAGHMDEIKKRTGMSERSLRRIFAELREHDVLIQTQAPAPGRPAAFVINYAQLATWLQPDDREDFDRLNRERRPNRPGNGGQTGRGTPAPQAGVNGNAGQPDHHRRPAGPPSPATVAGVPIEIAGASSKEPAEEQQQQRTGQEPGEARAIRHARAAAAAEISSFEFEDLGRQAGLDPALAAQCAAELARRDWADRDTALVALERLSERLATEGVRNPAGLFLAILTRPGGPEPSRRSIRRAKSEDARRRAYLAGLSQAQVTTLARRVAVALPEAGLATEQGVWLVDPSGRGPHARAARDAIWRSWDRVVAARQAPAEAVTA